jgi:hypothetical protein
MTNYITCEFRKVLGIICGMLLSPTETIRNLLYIKSGNEGMTILTIFTGDGTKGTSAHAFESPV